MPNATSDIDELLLQLRGGQEISGELQHRVAQFPTIDDLRGRLTRSDIPAIIEMAGVPPNAGGGIAFALLKRFINEPLVRNFLLEQWMASTSYERRQNVLWPLLDIPDLADDIHREAFQFVEANLSRFIEGCISWWGTQFLESAIRRMSHHHSPPQKAWLYMCVAMGSEDKNGLINLLEGMQRDPWGINAEVAGKLLNRLHSSRY